MTTGTFTVGGGWTMSVAFVSGSGKVHYNGTGTIRANTYNDLEISGAGTKTMSGSITVNGTLVVNPGGAFQANTASQLITLNKAGTPLVNSGTITSGIIVYAGTSDQELAAGTYNRIRLSNGNKIIPNGAVVESLNQFEVGSPLEFQGNGSAISGGALSGLGAMTMDTGTLTFHFTFTNTGLFTPGTGTVIYDLAGDQTINASTYHNLQIQGTGTKTFESGETRLSGDLIVNCATTLGNSTDLYVDGNITGDNVLTAGGTGSLISIKGDWLHTGTFNMGTGLVIYEGTNQIIENLEYYTLQLNNGTKTIDGTTLTINKLLQINANTILDMGSDTLNIAAPGTSILINNGTLSGTGTVYFSNAAAQTIPAINYYNLLFGGGTKTFASGTTIVVENDWIVNTPVTMTGSQNATIGRDLLLNTGGFIDQGSGTIRIGRNWLANGGTFDRGTGTVIYEGGNQTIAPFTYASLTCSGTGTKTITGDVDISRVLSIDSGVTFNRSTYTVTLSFNGTPMVIDGTLTGNGKFIYSGTGTQNIAATSYYDLEFSGATKNLPADTSIEILNDWVVGSATVFGNNVIVNLSGNISGAGTFTMNNGVLNIGGDWLKTGTFTPGTGTIHYNGATQTIAALPYYNLQISSSGEKTLAASTTVSSILTLNNPASLGLSSFTLNLSSSGTPFINTGILDSGTSTVNYTGTGETNIAAGDYYNLNGTGGNRTLPDGEEVGIAGAFTPGTGAYIIIGSLVNFNGSDAQTIPEFTFNDLILSGSGAKEILGSTEVTVKTIEIQDGPSLDILDDGQLNIVD